MKKKNLFYLGLILGFVFLIGGLITKNRTLSLVLIFAFALFTSISCVNLVHNRMKKEDKNYQISLKDERSIFIKDKTMAAMGKVFLFVNILIAIIALIYEENIAGILLLTVSITSPMALYLLEKHYQSIY